MVFIAIENEPTIRLEKYNNPGRAKSNAGEQPERWHE